MKKGTLIGLVIGVLLVIVIFMGVGSYNRLVAADTDADSKLSQIDVQLQRRHDLIPNLVSTVKGYAAHESEVLTAIADARARLGGASTPAEKAAADNQLSGALSRLLVVVENYPNLKADAQFSKLMDDLSGTENRIAVARKDYNDSATTFNAKVRKFPTSIYASMFGFDKKQLFTAQEGADQAPEVKF